MSDFWLISVRECGAGRSIDLAKLNEISEKKGFSKNFEFLVPRLKMGTLDPLMKLNEELGKIDTNVESVVNRMSRAYLEVVRQDPERAESGDAERELQTPELRVNGSTLFLSTNDVSNTSSAARGVHSFLCMACRSLSREEVAGIVEEEDC